MVRELGFMNSTLAATDYSPSAVHTLLEISAHGAMTAAQLVQILGLEKSSVSRMLSRLLAAGELQEKPDGEDARFKQLELTEQGRGTVGGLTITGRCGWLMRLCISMPTTAKRGAGADRVRAGAGEMPRRTKARCGKQRDDCARLSAGNDWPHCADARRVLCPAP
jgi:predicted ArsR family transcriptional regulator